MIKTICIKDLENKADNVYEAIMVIAKRARQINDEQRQQTSSEKEYDDEYDEYEEEGIMESSEPYLKLPKPSLLSLNEFMEGKIRQDYEPEQNGENEKGKE